MSEPIDEAVNPQPTAPTNSAIPPADRATASSANATPEPKMSTGLQQPPPQAQVQGAVPKPGTSTGLQHPPKQAQVQGAPPEPGISMGLQPHELSPTPEGALAPGHPSPPQNRLLPWLTYLLLMPLIALATTAFGCVSLVAGLWDKSGRQQHAIAHAWAKVLLLISLSPVTLIGAEKLHEHETAVYASNHLSYYDTPVLFAKLPFQFRILAKQSLWKIPFIGWYLNRSGQVPVDQSGVRSAIASLNRGVSTLKSGLPLVLFPEGGRAATGHTQPFVSGAAYMAIKAQLPLIPLTLVGTYELLPIHTYHLTPRPLAIIVGDPIPTTGLTTRDADALTQRLREVITTTYMQHHKE